MRNPRQTFLPGVFYVYWNNTLFAIHHNKFPHKGYAENFFLAEKNRYLIS